jgi:hypothetical protein
VDDAPVPAPGRRRLLTAGLCLLLAGRAAAQTQTPPRRLILVLTPAVDDAAPALDALKGLPGGYDVRRAAPNAPASELDAAAVLVWWGGATSGVLPESVGRAVRENGVGYVALGGGDPLPTGLRPELPAGGPTHPLRRGLPEADLSVRPGPYGTAERGRVVTLPFPPSSSGNAAARRALRNAVLWAARDEAGIWEDADPSAKAARAAGEPPLSLILRDAGYGGTNVTAGGEVFAPLLRKAGPGPVRVTVLAAYGVAKTSRGGWYRLAAAAAPERVELWTVAPENNKRAKPPLAPGSRTTFEPGPTADAPFGLWVASEGFPGEFIHTEDARQEAIPRFGKNRHKAHAYAAVRSDGTPVRDALLYGFEYSTNDDNQEAVLLVENVRPVAAAATDLPPAPAPRP